MKYFIKKTALFILLFLLIHFMFYSGYNLFFNHKTNANSIFIWGDSQTYQGIDLNTLKNETNKNIYSAARHGAGVYDFLTFVKKIPPKSTVLVAISKPVQIRKKDQDWNRSGISFSALITILLNGYSFRETFNIIRNNMIPRSLFVTKSNLYEYSDTITITEPIDLFVNSFKTIPIFLADKQTIYTEGLKALKEKKCKINFIIFPFHPTLNKIEENSPIKRKTDNFTNRVVKEFGQIKQIDTLYLDGKYQVFHDLTHLNEYGAKQVAAYLSSKLERHDESTIVVKIK
jgi:hypothetical protein